jgi:dihydropyrimidinase
VFDPEAELTLGVKSLHMRVDYNPYEGRKVKGVPRTVLVRGKPVIEDRRFVGRAGQGEFLKRGTYALP